MALGSALARPFRSLASSRRGNVAVFVAIGLPVGLAMVAGAVDLSRASTTRAQLQDSLDSAALVAARSSAVTDAELQVKGELALRTNLQTDTNTSLIGSEFRNAENGRRVVANATARVPSAVLGLFSNNRIDVRAEADVLRSSRDIEVALVLDTTGSMAGSRIADLRSAATELVNIVVKDQQTPFYTKVAVVPYAMSVNVGSYATAARGPVTAGKSITGATRANPVVITSNNHGFANGARVYITGVSGMTQLNNKEYVVANKTSNTFQLQGVDGRNYSSFRAGSGMAYCTTAGCQYFGFDNAESRSERRVHQISNCVSERTGARAYTDASPSTQLLGRNYPATANPCSSAPLIPLTSNKTTLRNAISTLNASGSTGGHVGVAWGWYAVSPNFASLWPTESDPAPYNNPELIKAVVLMTDGEYNSAFCNGVISKDSTSGSGATEDHIDCNAPNGHAFEQARSLCTAMKAQGVIVYTVGFDVVNDERARTLVNQCASTSNHVYLPSSGTALREAFRAIAQDLSNLRLAS